MAHGFFNKYNVLSLTHTHTCAYAHTHTNIHTQGTNVPFKSHFVLCFIPTEAPLTFKPIWCID